VMETELLEESFPSLFAWRPMVCVNKKERFGTRGGRERERARREGNRKRAERVSDGQWRVEEEEEKEEWFGSALRRQTMLLKIQYRNCKTYTEKKVKRKVATLTFFRRSHLFSLLNKICQISAGPGTYGRPCKRITRPQDTDTM